MCLTKCDKFQYHITMNVDVIIKFNFEGRFDFFLIFLIFLSDFTVNIFLSDEAPSPYKMPRLCCEVREPLQGAAE